MTENKNKKVKAELVPVKKNELAETDSVKKEHDITRRRVLEAAAGALALFMFPKDAFGLVNWFYYPPLAGSGWEGAPNSSTVYNGSSYTTARVGPTWWACGGENDWNAQFLCFAWKLSVCSIYTNELYDLMEMRVLASCGDMNGGSTYGGQYRKPRLWVPEDNDNRLKYWVDNTVAYDTNQRGIAFTNQDLDGYCADNYHAYDHRWYCTGYRDFGYNQYSKLRRRKADRHPYWYGLELWVYNVARYDYRTHGTVNDPEFKTATSSSCGSDICAYQQALTIRNDMSMFGKIVAIVPDAAKSNDLCLDVCSAGQASGTGVQLYGSGIGPIYTMRNFILGFGNLTEVGDITYYIYPAHVQTFNRVLNADNGRNALNDGTTRYQQGMHLFRDDDSEACRFWVTKSVDSKGRYNIISDASGEAFDRRDGGLSNGTAVRLHSGGVNGDEWNNEAHKWRLEEVFFKGSISFDKDQIRVGEKLSVVDPKKTCTPYDWGNTGSVRYLYRWYLLPTDTAEGAGAMDENKYPKALKARAWAHLANWGDQDWRDAYAGVGYPIKGNYYELETLKLKLNYDGKDVESGKAMGSICYAGCTGISNSGNFSWSGVCRDGEMLGATGVPMRITGIKIWLEGDIAKECDVAYRAFITNVGWTERYHSNGGTQEDAELCGVDTDGNAIRALQVFLIRKPRGAELYKEFSRDNYIIPGSDMTGRMITAQAMLALNLDGNAADGHRMTVDAYQGDLEIGTNSIALGIPIKSQIEYYVDGEDSPCFTDDTYKDGLYQINPKATQNAHKSNCLELSEWFTDPECTVPYVPAEVKGTLKLYAYNRCSLDYGTTDRSCVLDTSYNWSTDASMTTALDVKSLYPASDVVKYGTKVTFAGPWSAWCTDAGKTRCVTSTPGVYGNRSGKGSPVTEAVIKGNSTVYVDWPWSGYDGVMSAW